MKTKIDEVTALIADLQLSELHSIRHQLNVAIDAIEESQTYEFDDVVRIDSPLLDAGDDEYPVLKLKFPFSLSLDDQTRWRLVRVTHAAQIELIGILAKHLSDGGRVTEIQLPKVTKQ